MKRFFTQNSAFKCVMVFLTVCAMQSGFAADRTVEALTDEALVLSEAGELHLTSESLPLSNSSINISHPDAWVFFDNIKPSVALANFGEFIKINGAAMVSGTNARIAIYKHGAVVMPHGSSFKPLTVFSRRELAGRFDSNGCKYLLQ